VLKIAGCPVMTTMARGLKKITTLPGGVFFWM
jgi:hypothetical protein